MTSGFPVHRCSHNVMIPHDRTPGAPFAWKCGDCGYIYGWHDRHPRGTEPPTTRALDPSDDLAAADLDADAGTHDDAEPGRSND